jgi:hypothetical protein
MAIGLGRFHFDAWQEQRAAAEVLPNGLKVLRSATALGQPVATIFKPKATKPTHDVWFHTVERRDAFIQKTSDDYDASLARKAQRRRDEREGDLSQCDPGAIFANVWGYEQTNVDYYEVVKRSGSTVWIRPIGEELVPGSEGYMCERVRPAKGSFLAEPCKVCGGDASWALHCEMLGSFEHAYEPKPGGNTQRKRVTFCSGKPYLSFRCGSGSLVNVISFGNADALVLDSHYQSHYA